MTGLPVGETTGSPTGGLRGWFSPRDLRKWRWLALPLLLVLLLLWSPDLPSIRGGSRDSNRSVASAPAGAPSATSVVGGAAVPVLAVLAAACPLGIEPGLLLLLEDDSSSVASDRRRYPESRQFVDWISESAYCHDDDQAAVIHFATTAASTGPFPLRTESKRITAALGGPDASVGSDTRLASAVEQATAIARRYPSHHPTLVINTDGDINDAIAAYAALAMFPGDVHIVAIGKSLNPTWMAVRKASVRVLTDSTKTGEVARGLADIWLQATGRAP